MELRKIFFFVIPFSFIYTNYAYDKSDFQKILDNKKERTFLLSYPRSGNTWMRYCIEYLTQRPSFNRFNQNHDINFPLGWMADFPLDISKCPIEKIHFKKELIKTGADDCQDALIFIIRNPKEALIRHAGKSALLEAVHSGTIPDSIKIYFEALHIFDSWQCSKKMIIYYEDLLLNPKKVLREILAFLNEPQVRLEEFLSEYHAHKKKCLSLYKVSASGGNDPLYHSKSLTDQERKQIDLWIEAQFLSLWVNYLQDHYSEDNLNFSLHSLK